MRKKEKRNRKRMRRKKIFPLATICVMSLTALTSCRTTGNISGYTFPDLGEKERIVTDKDITVLNESGKTVFYFDGEKETVTIPLWYWNKILRYGIDTGGIKVD